MIGFEKMDSYSREGLCPLAPLRALCHFDSRITALLGWEQHGLMAGRLSLFEWTFPTTVIPFLGYCCL